MKQKIAFKYTAFYLLFLLCTTLQADDLTWSTDGGLVEINAVPTYDSSTKLLTSVAVTLSDSTLLTGDELATQSPYVYPAFIFPFIPPSPLSKSQKVEPVAEKSTTSGEMSFIGLNSSPVSTFLFIDLEYGDNHIKVNGSIIQVPLATDGS